MRKNVLNLKEGYLVRYADDFKILCRDWKTAQKWYHAVKLYSKRTSETRYFTRKIARLLIYENMNLNFLVLPSARIEKGKKRVAHTGIKAEKIQKIKAEAKKHIRKTEFFTNSPKCNTFQ